MECGWVSVSLILMFLSSAFSSSASAEDVLVYDAAGRPLKTNTLYRIFHRGADSWLHGISYSPRDDGSTHSPLPVVQTGPEYSWGMPVVFLTNNTVIEEDVNITTETPLSVAFNGRGAERWDVDVQDPSRFVINQFRFPQPTPSFFIKNNGVGSYYIAFQAPGHEYHYLRVAAQNNYGPRRLAVQECRGDGEPLAVRFNYYERPPCLTTTPQMMDGTVE